MPDCDLASAPRFCQPKTKQHINALVCTQNLWLHAVQSTGATTSGGSRRTRKAQPVMRVLYIGRRLVEQLYFPPLHNTPPQLQVWKPGSSEALHSHIHDPTCPHCLDLVIAVGHVIAVCVSTKKDLRPKALRTVATRSQLQLPVPCTPGPLTEIARSVSSHRR